MEKQTQPGSREWWFPRSKAASTNPTQHCKRPYVLFIISLIQGQIYMPFSSRINAKTVIKSLQPGQLYKFNNTEVTCLMYCLLKPCQHAHTRWKKAAKYNRTSISGLKPWGLVNLFPVEASIKQFVCSLLTFPLLGKDYNYSKIPFQHP